MMTKLKNVPMRTVKSFVIRRGRMTESQETALASQWSIYGLNLSDGLLDAEKVFGRSAELVFEIGFGMGEALISMAQANPHQDFIGVEVHPPGIGNVLRIIAEQQLTNVRIYKTDAKDVLHQCIADNALTRMQIFFPDPWHKTKHHKRRLIQQEFVQQIHAKLKAGGVLHLATDWEPYANQMLRVMSEAENFTNRAGDQLWVTEHARPLTKFEQRGHRLGHGVWDLMFEKVR
ncbi:MAG: tRNA (guanosine(46)-N7)-methyltransferase TrmB [Pseudomonadota bacterium]